MTDQHDAPLEFDDLDRLFDALLAGEEPSPAMPAWSADVALLVRAAEAPPRPDELAAEYDIVRVMSEVRRSVRVAGATDVVDDLPAPAATPAGTATVVALGDRPAGRTRDRGYRAKHAARLERSRHPAVRTVGRVVAMKAAAVTTAAVIGVAAAAATTGIVATVVVPALNDEPDEPKPAQVTTPEPDEPRSRPPGGSAEGTDPLGLHPRAQAGCPLLPTACAPVTLPVPPPATVPPVAPQESTATTLPAEPPTEPAPVDTTGSPVTTETPETPTTTEPPPTTTVPEDPPTDPSPGPFSLPDQATRGKAHAEDAGTA